MTDFRADDVRVACPLFQEGRGGSIPTSALDFQIEGIEFDVARELNRRWHSTLPRLGIGSVANANRRFDCFGAIFDGVIWAVAIWSLPAARKNPQDGSVLELRRFAVGPGCPKNTPSRMLRVMTLLFRRSKPGCHRLISQHDLGAHSGTIYRASGWREVGVSKGHEWSCKTRSRPKAQSAADKQRWEKILKKAQP